MLFCNPRSALIITRNRVWSMIEVSYLLLGCIVGCLVCDSDSSSLSATKENDNCSPRWIVHYQSRSDSPRGTYSHTPSATSPQLCLEACVDNKTCVIAHWTTVRSRGCYSLSWRSRRRWNLSHITQFEIVRQCDNTSGTQSKTPHVSLRNTL